MFSLGRCPGWVYHLQIDIALSLSLNCQFTGPNPFPLRPAGLSIETISVAIETPTNQGVNLFFKKRQTTGKNKRLSNRLTFASVFCNFVFSKPSDWFKNKVKVLYHVVSWNVSSSNKCFTWFRVRLYRSYYITENPIPFWKLQHLFYSDLLSINTIFTFQRYCLPYFSIIHKV